MRDATGTARYLSPGRLSANDQPGIIAREGMKIDSVRQGPYLPIERLSLRPGPRPSCAGPMLGRPSPPTQPFAGVSYICRKKYLIPSPRAVPDAANSIVITCDMA
jgi:hypothetical protein